VKRAARNSPERIAAALALAETQTDRAAAEAFGVSVGTLRGWRRKAKTDPELGGAVRGARRSALAGWREEAAKTFVAICRRVQRMADMDEEIPIGLIAAAKTYGSINIQSGALLFDDEGDEEPQGLRLVTPRGK